MEKQPLLDRLIGFVSPRMAAERAYYRMVAAELPRMSSYRGAVQTRLDTPWAASGYASARVNEINRSTDLRRMRERARQLEQDNVLAAGVLDRAVENVIGTGIRVRPMTSSPEFNEQAKRLWRQWTAGKSADVRATHTFAQLQRLFYRARLRDGDCGVLLTEVGGDPKLQIIEGEYIDRPWGQGENGATIIDGVEVNAALAPVAFWLRVENEGRRETSLRVRARDMAFTHRASLYSQVRGESAFNGGYLLFDQIVGYLDAVVVASRVGASQAMFVKKKNPSVAAQTYGTTKNAAGNNQAKLPIEPGMIHFLGLDEDVQAFNPAQPQQQMAAAITTFSRFVGLKFGLTIEQVLLDFSQTSYSSARAARLQAEQTAYQEQDEFNASFLARVYPWFIAKSVKAGKFTVTPPPDAWAYEWIPQGRPWVDPTKEIAAAKEAVALGVETRSNIAMERGYDFHELCRVNAEDVAAMKEVGLPTDLSPNGGSQVSEADAHVNRMRAMADAYAISVRAGAITPNLDDETHFRKTVGLPPPNADVRQAWADTDGVRQPITLQQDDGDNAGALDALSKADAANSTDTNNNA